MGLLNVGGNNDKNQCDPLYKSFTNVIKIACGEHHSISLLDNGTIECWGDNSDPIYKTFTNIKLPQTNNYLLKFNIKN